MDALFTPGAAKAMHSHGNSLRKIAAHFGVSLRRVQTAIDPKRRAAWDRGERGPSNAGRARMPSGSPAKMSGPLFEMVRARRGEVERWYWEYFPNEEIAKRLGINANSCRPFLSAMGIVGRSPTVFCALKANPDLRHALATNGDAGVFAALKARKQAELDARALKQVSRERRERERLTEIVATSADRNSAIFAAAREGIRETVIGATFGITHQRVGQIVTRELMRSIADRSAA